MFGAFEKMKRPFLKKKKQDKNNKTNKSDKAKASKLGPSKSNEEDPDKSKIGKPSEEPKLSVEKPPPKKEVRFRSHRKLNSSDAMLLTATENGLTSKQARREDSRLKSTFERDPNAYDDYLASRSASKMSLRGLDNEMTPYEKYIDNKYARRLSKVNRSQEDWEERGRIVEGDLCDLDWVDEMANIASFGMEDMKECRKEVWTTLMEIEKSFSKEKDGEGEMVNKNTGEGEMGKEEEA